MSKLTPTGKFWLTYFLFLFLVAMSGISWADPSATSQSASGAQSGAASQAGAAGIVINEAPGVAGAGERIGAFATKTSVDFGTTNVDASDFKDRAPGVFAAGVTAGGSNPCVVSIGGGLSVPGGGINFANAYNDGECNIRETLRLVAAISTAAKIGDPVEKGNQILLREIACQSVTMWDAFERTYNVTNDQRYFCENERPENKGRFIAGRIRHAASGGSRDIAYDLDGGNPVKHKVVSSMLSQGYEDDAWAMLMED